MTQEFITRLQAMMARVINATPSHGFQQLEVQDVIIDGLDLTVHSRNDLTGMAYIQKMKLQMSVEVVPVTFPPTPNI